MFKWTVQDSVRVRYFLDALGTEGGASPDTIVPSPHGKYFFFISRHGDLSCDCNRYELSVFAVKDVVQALNESTRASDRAPAPLRTVAMSHRKLQAIRSGFWDGEERIEFVGVKDPGSTPQVYQLQVASGELKALTDAPGAAGVLGYARQGEGIVYAWEDWAELPRYPMYALTTKRLAEMVALNTVERHKVARSRVSYGGGRSWQMKSGFVPANGTPWFSPDGRRALMVRHPQAVPAAWVGYDGVKTLGAGPPPAPDELTQFMWVDLEHEREEPVFDAPTGAATRAGARVASRALWSEDGQRVVLVNTALPLSGGEGSEPGHAGMAYIVSVDVETRRWEVLEPVRQASGLTVKDVNWTKPGQEFLVRHTMDGKPAPGTIYSWRNSRWTAHAVNASVGPPSPAKEKQKPVLAQGLSVTLRQSANDPPVLVASRQGREIPLTGPDAALADLWIARTEPFQWRYGEGATRTGGLLLPRNLPSDGKRIPLVIQVFGYEPDDFHPDGAAPTAFAAQALVAQGMAVLNIDTPLSLPEMRGRPLSPQLLTMFTDWVDSAATAAAQAYPIDLSRVGLVGFSGTGFLVRYTLTHPGRLRMGAAEVADSYTHSYLLTLAGYAMGSALSNADDGFYGGPFYEAKTSWLEREVSFNVDRVQAPVLFVHNDELLTLFIDTIGAFKAARKPFDYLILPEAGHELKAPRQREASLDATVDWMAFWLQGREGARPEKAERYERWRAQRTLQEQQRTAAPQ